MREFCFVSFCIVFSMMKKNSFLTLSKTRITGMTSFLSFPLHPPPFFFWGGVAKDKILGCFFFFSPHSFISHFIHVQTNTIIILAIAKTNRNRSINLSHNNTHSHTDIYKHRHTHNHIHIQADTHTHIPPPPTHTKNVLSTMAEYIHCKLPYVRKHINAPIEVYTILTHYHCIIHILQSKSMIPSRSCKTATPLWIYHRTY